MQNIKRVVNRGSHPRLALVTATALAFSLIGTALAFYSWQLTALAHEDKRAIEDYANWTSGGVPAPLAAGPPRQIQVPANLATFIDTTINALDEVGESPPLAPGTTSRVIPRAAFHKFVGDAEGWDVPGREKTDKVYFEFATFAGPQAWPSGIPAKTANRFVLFAHQLTSTVGQAQPTGGEDYRAVLARHVGIDLEATPSVRILAIYLATPDESRVSFPARNRAFAGRIKPGDMLTRPWWNHKDATPIVGTSATCVLSPPYQDVGRTLLQLVRTITCTSRTDSGPGLYKLAIDLRWLPPTPAAAASIPLVGSARGQSGIVLLGLALGVVGLGLVGAKPADFGYALSRPRELTALRGTIQNRDTTIATSGQVAETGLNAGWRGLSARWSRTVADGNGTEDVFSASDAININEDPDRRGVEIWELRWVTVRDWELFGAALSFRFFHSPPDHEVVLTYESDSEPDVELKPKEILLPPTLQNQGPDKPTPEKLKQHIERSIHTKSQGVVAGREDVILWSDTPPPPQVPKLVTPTGDYRRHNDQSRRLGRRRLDFQDGLDVAKKLYPGQRVRAVVQLSYAIELMERGMPEELLQGNTLERIVLCTSEAHLKDALDEHRPAFERYVHQHRNNSLFVAFASELPPGLMTLQQEDFALIGRDKLVMVVEGLSRAGASLDFYGYVSWRRADIDFYEALYAAIRRAGMKEATESLAAEGSPTARSQAAASEQQ